MLNRIDRLLAFLAEDPDDPFLLFSLAREYHKAGNLQRCLETYLKLAKSHPAYIGTYYHLGKLYEELQNAEEASAIYSRGIKVADEIGDSHAAGELKAALDILKG